MRKTTRRLAAAVIAVTVPVVICSCARTARQNSNIRSAHSDSDWSFSYVQVAPVLVNLGARDSVRYAVTEKRSIAIASNSAARLTTRVLLPPYFGPTSDSQLRRRSQQELAVGAQSVTRLVPWTFALVDKAPLTLSAVRRLPSDRARLASDLSTYYGFSGTPAGTIARVENLGFLLATAPLSRPVRRSVFSLLKTAEGRSWSRWGPECAKSRTVVVCIRCGKDQDVLSLEMILRRRTASYPGLGAGELMMADFFHGRLPARRALVRLERRAVAPGR